MGLFDKWRKPRIDHYDFANRPVIDQRYETNRVASRSSQTGWLWLLLIPLFLLLGLGAYNYFGNNPTTGSGKNFLSTLFQRGDDTKQNDEGLQLGVGGSPATPTPTSTTTQGVGGSAVTPTATQTNDDSSNGAVQSASDRVIPSEAPSTGKASN